MPRLRPLVTLSLLSCMALLACSDSQEPPASAGTPVRLAFIKDTFAVRQLGSTQLTAVGYDAQGAVVAQLPIQYSISGSAATTSAAGMAHGVKPGVGTVTAKLGNLETTATLEVFGHPEGVVVDSQAAGWRPFGVAVSRDGVIYVTQLDNAHIIQIDTADQVIDSIAVGSTPTGVTFAPDGRTAYVTNQFDDNVGVVDVDTRHQSSTIPIPAAPFVPFVAPDGQKVFITSNTSNVYVADAATGAIVDTIVLSHAPNGFALHPDESRVYISTFVGGTVTEVGIASNATLRTFNPGGTPQAMVVSADGSELYVANEQGWVDVYDLSTGMAVAQIPLTGGGFGMALSPDQQPLYVSEPGAGLVEVVNIPSRSVIHTLNVGGIPRRVAFTRHGGIAVIPNELGYVSFVR